MTDVANWFLRAAPCWAIAGMALGLHMAASQDHAQHVTHAHINLLGWVTLALYGLYLKTSPAAAAMRQARWLFWLHNVALAVLSLALLAIYSGRLWADPIAAVSSFAMFAGMGLFTWIVFATTRS
jgi:hypothetical protein